MLHSILPHPSFFSSQIQYMDVILKHSKEATFVHSGPRLVGWLDDLRFLKFFFLCPSRTPSSLKRTKFLNKFLNKVLTQSNILLSMSHESRQFHSKMNIRTGLQKADGSMQTHWTNALPIFLLAGFRCNCFSLALSEGKCIALPKSRRF